MSSTNSRIDETAPASDWSIEDSSQIYRIAAWGEPYFSINEFGHVAVSPAVENASAIDIATVVAELRRRGVQFPVLIRFQDILRSQVHRLNRAFETAIAETGYRNVYRGVYPIKVNQLHEVVDELLDAGRPYGMGLECGSKAELIAALPQVDGDTLLICNGVKDRTMLSLMLSGQRLGQNVIPVVERYSEFTQIKSLAFKAGVVPRLGVRIKLATIGAGRWSASSGINSKFGLSVNDLLRMLAELESGGQMSSLRLLHCHIGSQITDIYVLKQAIKEIARIYVELTRRGAAIEYLDLGGGLGVNYDKDRLEEDAGINYSLQEYANAVVYTVKEVCDANGVKEPVLVTESGRALTAHHSVLIVPVLGSQLKDDMSNSLNLPDDAPDTLKALNEILQLVAVSEKTNELVEAFHDANERFEELKTLFALDYLDIEQRALSERLYWRICSTILPALQKAGEQSLPELEQLELLLTDQYLCDFSVFQSMLDHWAIGQPFPILPIEHLDRRPDRRGILMDLTCDSDGKVSHYVSGLPDNRFLPLHSLDSGQPYYLGFFLMGAYEDIVGDAHNLFGRVSEAHIYADAEEENGFWVEKIIPGTAIQEMLAQVQYFPNDLHRRMSELTRAKIQAGVVRPAQGMSILDQYLACFSQHTYCAPADVDSDSNQ